MAKGKELVKQSQQAIAPKEDWENELANEAKEDRSNAILGVPRITHKGGVLKIDGKPVAASQDNRKVVRMVVLGHAFVKTDYEKPFEEGSNDTPRCYAFGRTSKNLYAHDASPEKQNVVSKEKRLVDGVEREVEVSPCTGCKWNEFGSATKGSGKHCSDRVRLVGILADDLAVKGDVALEKAINSSSLYQIDLPPTSLTGFGRYLGSLTDLTPNGNIKEAITEISTEGREEGGYYVNLRFLDAVPREAMKALMKRGSGVFEMITAPWPVTTKNEESKPAASSKPVKGQKRK